jgi:hypothetical protein
MSVFINAVGIAGGIALVGLIAATLLASLGDT